MVHCHLDRQKDEQSLEELQEIVNNALAKHWGIHSRPVGRIVFRHVFRALIESGAVKLKDRPLPRTETTKKGKLGDNTAGRSHPCRTSIRGGQLQLIAWSQAVHRNNRASPGACLSSRR